MMKGEDQMSKILIEHIGLDEGGWEQFHYSCDSYSRDIFVNPDEAKVGGSDSGKLFTHIIRFSHMPLEDENKNIDNQVCGYLIYLYRTNKRTEEQYYIETEE